MSEKVMNNPDLRGQIFKFFRKKSKVKCVFCEKIIVLEKKNRTEYLAFDDILGKYYMCIRCFDKKRYYLEWYEF